MRIVSYNLFEGAQNNYDQLKQFIGEYNPDIVCLQETNGWDNGSPSRLERFCKDTGLSHHVFGRGNTVYTLATVSKVPILSSTVHKDGFWHCAVHIKVMFGTEFLNIWNVHLSPVDEISRLAEVKRLIAMINIDENTIVVGDFNSLSREDNYPNALHKELLKLNIIKFGLN